MKKIIILLSILLFGISLSIVCINGKEISFSQNVTDTENITVKYDKNYIDCKYEIKDNRIYYNLKSLKQGKTEIIVEGIKDNQPRALKTEIFIHKFGIITINSYFGACSGDLSFVISFYIIIVLIIIYLITNFIKNKNIYSYGKARQLGLIIFLGIVFLWHITFFIYDLTQGYRGSINHLLSSIKADSYLFLTLSLPVLFLITLFVTITNIRLLIKEGKRWTNMLGTILGGIFCLAIIIVILFSVYRVNDVSTFIKDYIYNVVAITMTYLECILLGVSILAYKSAKRIPSFDKDAIIILGCKIRNDGSLTNLLKSRVDRAIEFSKMQKQETGKDIIFVPSGGQGDDEIISEAEAMKKYLINKGIKKDKIIIEDKATNTYENIKFSNKLINDKIKNAKIAFSTTNYHVFRAEVIASKQNIKIEGIGAKTKMYYWINAFIREFIATLVSEKKDHIKTIIELAILMLFFTVITIF